MHQLVPVSMRLELVQALNHSSFINDTYNSDLGSLGTALDFLGRQQQHPRKTVILSDILQTGLRSEEHTSELQSLMRISYAVFCLKKKKNQQNTTQQYNTTTT